ncbi:carboxymuconolactone decarboxylase family protein [Mitsuaria sp. WAJ17]|uniref:carboxymuconolactone decarboxylase family protein n=1 Tax=Mitsuaria sp. WAJ17 TaxID=2761452 RepID=UPI0016046426|nr:carboxymuconolactone decarboxylase family protein [Mitsuaria sp. WAJ17]MBB2485055.1 carboxymuconolactone decarboxylase family protein [Mitsuaria sp. WAJ17]
MSSSYQTPEDLLLARQLAEKVPMESQAWLTFDHAVFREGGHIGAKQREWIALGVALATQCAYCIDVHVRGAKRLGSTAEELAEVAAVAAAVKGGATLAHGLMALRLHEGLGAQAGPAAAASAPQA